jgi:hypothetical protein
MALTGMDNVLIVVDDLEAAKAFFVELGLTLEGEATVASSWRSPSSSARRRRRREGAQGSAVTDGTDPGRGTRPRLPSTIPAPCREPRHRLNGSRG